ncbi:hypothetical protein PHMEG_00028258 [Phytophthora megakarya]|uniref:Ubiquitin-like protease family profile domain-containing protein n=1 Tax=Phytophthora megakarya TaxID=4795 RepID=A0A225V3L1_9STRA|nr:hypothetical protein PHMEG_00028258 [Phytophthora megakarya]
MDANVFGHIFNEYKLASRKRDVAYKACCDVFGTYSTINKVVGGYFDRELKKKYPDRRRKNFAAKEVTTKPIPKNQDDCGVFVIYFIKRVVDAFLRGNPQLLSNIANLCTAPRSARFTPSMFRKDIINAQTQKSK